MIQLQDKDLEQLKAKGITTQQIETQLTQFENGFPYLKLERAAAIGQGIIAPTATS